MEVVLTFSWEDRQHLEGWELEFKHLAGWKLESNSILQLTCVLSIGSSEGTLSSVVSPELNT